MPGWLYRFCVALVLGALAVTAQAAGGVLTGCLWQPPLPLGDIRRPSDLDRELLVALAAEYEMELRIRSTAFAQIADDLAAGHCDVAFTGLPRTAEQRARLHFGPTLIISDVRALVARGQRTIREWSDLGRPGRRLLVVRGGHPEIALAAVFPSAEFVVVETERARVEDVESGRVDAAIVLELTAMRFAAVHPWMRVVSPPRPLAPLPLSLATGRQRPELVARIDAFSQRIRKDGRLQTLAERLGYQPLVAP